MAYAQARFLEDLTPNMARALTRCHALVVLVVDHPDDPGGPTSYGIHRATLTALQARGLVEQQRNKRMRLVWQPTAEGLRIIGTEAPRLLAASSDALYTTEPGRALFPDAGEAVDELTQQRISAEARERDHALAAGVDADLYAALDALRAQRRELARIAHNYGIDVRDYVRRLDRAYNGLEQQVRKQRSSARTAA